MGFIRMMIAWVAGNYIRMLIIAACAAVMSGLIYAKGRIDSNQACAKADALAIAKGVSQDAKIRNKVRQMAVPDIDHALSKWVRPD